MVDFIDKSPNLTKAAKKIEGITYYPIFLIYFLPNMFAGLILTFICNLHQIFHRNVTSPYKYTSNEVFKLSDGGQILIEYLGEMDRFRPLLLVFPGIANDSQTPTSFNMCAEA
jgi:hypothetical protein